MHTHTGRVISSTRAERALQLPAAGQEHSLPAIVGKSGAKCTHEVDGPVTVKSPYILICPTPMLFCILSRSVGICNLNCF